MKERRKLERFELRFPALVVVESQGGGVVAFDLTTKDVSSDGAYLQSPSQLPEGAMVKMEFPLALDPARMPAKENSRAMVRVTGKVIRVDKNGAAIRFGNKFKIRSLGSAPHGYSLR